MFTEEDCLVAGYPSMQAFVDVRKAVDVSSTLQCALSFTIQELFQQRPQAVSLETLRKQGRYIEECLGSVRSQSMEVMHLFAEHARNIQREIERREGLPPSGMRAACMDGGEDAWVLIGLLVCFLR